MGRNPKFRVGDEVQTSDGWIGVVKEITNNSDKGQGLWYKLLNEKDYRDGGDAEPLHGSVWVQAGKLQKVNAERDVDVMGNPGKQGTPENEPDDDETHDQLTEKFAQSASSNGYSEGPGVAFHPLDQSREHPGEFRQPKGPGKVRGDEPSRLTKDPEHEREHFDHANLVKKIPSADIEPVSTDMFSKKTPDVVDEGAKPPVMTKNLDGTDRESVKASDSKTGDKGENPRPDIKNSLKNDPNYKK